jgi:hypothetical protein
MLKERSVTLRELALERNSRRRKGGYQHMIVSWLRDRFRFHNHISTVRGSFPTLTGHDLIGEKQFWD